MAVETDQFKLANIEWKYTKSREITDDRNPRPSIKTGVKSIKAACKACGYAWHAKTYDEGHLSTFIGGVILSCPSCHVEEKIKSTAIEQ